MIPHFDQRVTADAKMYHTWLYVKCTIIYDHVCTQFWRSVSASGHGNVKFDRLTRPTRVRIRPAIHPKWSLWIKPNKSPFPGNMIRNQNVKMHIFSGVFKVWSWTINWSDSWLKSLDIVKLVRISSVRFISKMFLGWRSLKHYPVLCFQIASTTMLLIR